MRTVLRTAALLVVALLAANIHTAAAKAYSADRFDSRVRVLPGGTLEVTETVVFRFESGTFDHVFREIPTRRTDGIEIVRATMDGQPFPVGKGVGHLELSGRTRVKAQWRFAPTPPSTHEFILTYLARGVVTQNDAADLLVWKALPTEHEYRILASTVTIELPNGATHVSTGGAPPMKWHRVDGTVDNVVSAPAEASSAATSVIRSEARRIRNDGWVEASLALPRGSIVRTPPAWVVAAERARALAPRWLTAAVLIFIAGQIVLVGLRQRYDPPRNERMPQPAVFAAPPDSLATGLVGPLLASGHVGPPHAIATLFALAQRGVLSIDERPHGRFGHASFEIRHVSRRATLAPHERAVVDAIIQGSPTAETMSMGALQRRVMRGMRPFQRAVQQELQAAGLLDADRSHVRKRYLVVAATLVIAAAAVAIPTAVTLFGTYGGWPMLVPAAFALLGGEGFIFAAATTPLSNEGLRRREQWRAYRDYLRSVSRDRQAQPANAQALLPLVVATGLATNWVRYLKRHPGGVPAWFRTLSTSSPERTFGAFVASSGGAHGGGAGAGGAGGGASGAG
jgi:hypothetical protein